MTAPVVLHEVSRWYDEVLAVNEVSCEFGPGVTGLLGPNGAGKSTLIKVVTGAMRPSLGAVSLLGANPFDSPSVMRRVGLVPEQDPVYVGASAYDVVVYLTRLHGFSRGDATARAKEALERVGLGGAMNRSAAGFSKGMRQRVKLAQAMAHDPDVLILDEPMNGLDPVGRREITDIVHEFGASGRCAIVSSHVLHEVEAMTRRVLMMDHGRLVADGTIQEIRRDLSDRPHEVTLKTAAPRDLARRLAGLDGVERLQIGANALGVLTTKPDALFAEIARLVHEEGVPLQEFRPTDESLEAVFRYVTS